MGRFLESQATAAVAGLSALLFGVWLWSVVAHLGAFVTAAVR